MLILMVNIPKSAHMLQFLGPLLQDELEAELEELEEAELEEQLLQPATTAPAAPVPMRAGRQPVQPARQHVMAEEDELAALQAEMAL